MALEQYMTPAIIAADMLFEAHRKGDIAGLKVVDLGCGTGMLSIGSWYLDAGMVVGFDASENALETARMNAEDLGAEVDFKLSDIRDVTEGADTVVMNPVRMPASPRRPPVPREGPGAVRVRLLDPHGRIPRVRGILRREARQERGLAQDLRVRHPAHVPVPPQGEADRRGRRGQDSARPVTILNTMAPYPQPFDTNVWRLPRVRRPETGGSHEFRFRYARRRGRHRGGVRRRRRHLRRERHRLRVPDGYAGAR